MTTWLLLGLQLLPTEEMPREVVLEEAPAASVDPPGLLPSPHQQAGGSLLQEQLEAGEYLLSHPGGASLQSPLG